MLCCQVSSSWRHWRHMTLTPALMGCHLCMRPHLWGHPWAASVAPGVGAMQQLWWHHCH